MANERTRVHFIDIVKMPLVEKHWWEKAPLISAMIALGSLVVSYFAYSTSNAAYRVATNQLETAQKTLDEAKTFYRKQVSPYLQFHQNISADYLELRLQNWGTGIAVVDSIEVWVENEKIYEPNHPFLLTGALNRGGLKSAEFSVSSEIFQGVALPPKFGYSLVIKKGHSTPAEKGAFNNFLRKLAVYVKYHSIYDEDKHVHFDGRKIADYNFHEGSLEGEPKITFPDEMK